MMIRVGAFICMLSLLFQTAAATDFELLWNVAQYGGITANPGDTVTFTYGQSSDLWIHPTGDCTETGKIAVGAVGAGSATYNFTEADIGAQITFASNVDDTCERGQIITFTVLPITSAPSSAPTSAPSPRPTLFPTIETLSPTMAPTKIELPTMSPSEFPTITGATNFELVWFIAQYGDTEALPGDSVTFTYDEFSDVWIYPSGDCNQVGGIQVGGVGPGTAIYRFTDADAGKTITFTSSVGNNCVSGQIITFSLVDAPTPAPITPSPSIAPVTPSPTRSLVTPSPTARPISQPTMAPEPSAAPVVPEATTARATDLSQTLLGMIACDVDCQDAWIAQMFETTVNYFSTADTNINLVTNTPKITSVDVPRMRRLQGGAESGVTINYDHTFQYISEGAEDVEVNELAAQPLADEADRTKFVADLKGRGDSFVDLTGVTAIDAPSLPDTPSPTRSPTTTPDEQGDEGEEDKSIKSILSRPSVLIGIGAGVLLLLIIGLMCCRKKNKSGQTERAEPKEDSSKDGARVVDIDEPDEESVETTKEELIHIFAPPGKLGVVIDTPNDGAPFVHAVKTNSIIADRIKVNDKLVAVDDEDVRTMTAINVSKLIGKKTSNPSRKLTVLRTVTVQT